ncbi:hypothetical protein L2E82_16704 [Cichorium intybus]|uniref:Uncharacterized protein n=1 Tax=Cichorium intybus TaxID=13427 RepID=A0ACB9F6V7_CICIN|nr:hypothetical protein L2E82_16704 [Cichorium intybus]
MMSGVDQQRLPFVQDVAMDAKWHREREQMRVLAYRELYENSHNTNKNKEKGKRGDSPNLNPVSHCTSHGKIKAVLLPTSFFLFQFHTEILEIQKKSLPAKNLTKT